MLGTVKPTGSVRFYGTVTHILSVRSEGTVTVSSSGSEGAVFHEREMSVKKLLFSNYRQ